MQVKTIQIQNFRSLHKTAELNLEKINVITGENNSGKSSLLKALHLVQTGANINYADVRVLTEKAKIDLKISEALINNWGITSKQSAFVTIEISTQDRKSGKISTSVQTKEKKREEVNSIPNQAPHHFIIPFLSTRKTTSYIEDIKENNASLIANNMSYLSAKLSKIASPSHPNYKYYESACIEILGSVITNITTDNGQIPGVYLTDDISISIYQMGDGVPNIIHFLTYLATSENKLFLIEEPENDLHPKALKALLDLIIKSSEKNQFVVSTHSNIVVSHLCSSDQSKLFKVTSKDKSFPRETTISEIPRSSESRIEVLNDLGYSFSDYDIWDGWLILEESSAERIIKDYLIPIFAPKLGKIRTISANGTGNIEPTFNELNRLMLFIHLTPAYENKAWVIADGDDSGKAVIKRLKEKYKSVNDRNFSTFSSDQFERYYPEQFSKEIQDTIEIKNKEEKRHQKKILLDKVIDWLNEDSARAKKALKESASEVISLLQEIESNLK